MADARVTTFKQENFSKILSYAGVLLCIYLVIKLFLYHWDIISFPWPLGFREGASLLSTEMLLKGENPYALQNQPCSTNVYGILYSIAVYPFAFAFGQGLIVHRAVSGFFILCSCVTLLLINRRQRVPVICNLIGVIIFYASLLFGKTALAEPDALGLFAFLLSLSIPYFFNYSYPSIITSLLLGISAYFIKPYFALAIPYLASYLFLFISKKKGAIYSITALCISVPLFILVDRFMGTYFYNTYLGHLNIADNLLDWAVRQLILYSELNFGLLLLIVAAIVTSVSRKSVPSASGFSCYLPCRCFTVMDQPVFKLNLPSFYYFLVLSILLIYFKLGRHGGAYMTYLFQLISPFLVVTACSLISNFSSSRLKLVYLVLALNVLMICWDHNAFWSHRDEKSVDSAWQDVKSTIGAAHNILGSSVIAPLLLMQGKKIYDSGHSEYFVWSALKPPSRFLAFIFPRTDAIKEQYAEYMNEINTGIKNRKFDLIISDSIASKWLIPLDKLTDGYEQSRQIDIPMPNSDLPITFSVWVPKYKMK